MDRIEDCVEYLYTVGLMVQTLHSLLLEGKDVLQQTQSSDVDFTTSNG